MLWSTASSKPLAPLDLRTVQDIDVLVNSPDVDLVLLALHAPVAVLALETNNYVVVEKPSVLNHEADVHGIDVDTMYSTSFAYFMIDQGDTVSFLAASRTIACDDASGFPGTNTSSCRLWKTKIASIPWRYSLELPGCLLRMIMEDETPHACMEQTVRH